VTGVPDLDLSADVLTLTRALVDAPSVSGDEGPLADAVETALRALGGLEVERVGDTVLARTSLGRDTRVVLAGHLDTVPIADNVPSRLADGRLHGCGSSDMKSGDAVMLRLAGRFGVPGAQPAHDLTFVFYDNEEVESVKSGLGRVARSAAAGCTATCRAARADRRRDRAGCQGTLRACLEVTGAAAHSARSRLASTPSTARPGSSPRSPATRPARWRSTAALPRGGLNAVRIEGGVARQRSSPTPAG
jgi:succinyl-diaminopimelate desuccinylase